MAQSYATRGLSAQAIFRQVFLELPGPVSISSWGFGGTGLVALKVHLAGDNAARAAYCVESAVEKGKYMCKSIGTKSVIPVSVLTVLLVFCFSVSTSEAGVVIETDGVICVDGDTVFVRVIVPDAKGGCEDVYLVPSNGKGLLRAGQIKDGEPVGVRIVENNGRRQTHRGHVTVLK